MANGRTVHLQQQQQQQPVPGLSTCRKRIVKPKDAAATFRGKHTHTPGQAHLAFSPCVVGAPAYVNIFYVLFHTLPVTAPHCRLRCHSPRPPRRPVGHHLGGQGATLRRVAAALCGKCKFY